MLYLLDVLENIRHFLYAGGPVLSIIIILAFLLWIIIYERLHYYRVDYKNDVAKVQQKWAVRTEYRSWHAQAIKQKLSSELMGKLNQNMPLIKTIITLCPLFGLLGTVSGMINIFTVISLTGGSDAKLIAEGVSRATIPTMAGMVVAISGIFANIYLIRQKNDRQQKLNKLLLDPTS